MGYTIPACPSHRLQITGTALDHIGTHASGSLEVALFRGFHHPVQGFLPVFAAATGHSETPLGVDYGIHHGVHQYGKPQYDCGQSELSPQQLVLSNWQFGSTRSFGNEITAGYRAQDGG